jgi:hypothetical protein
MKLRCGQPWSNLYQKVVVRTRNLHQDGRTPFSILTKLTKVEPRLEVRFVV